ncbi:unnamed protein product [Closterium sp. Naga37s-1]|nr:unnamed protein product [Closterium sp. Naga37s-1]
MNPSRPGGYGARSGRYGGAAGTPAGAGKGPGGPSSRSNAALQAQQRLRALMSNTSDESQEDYGSQVRALSACRAGECASPPTGAAMGSAGGMRQPPTGGAMGRTRPAGGGYDAPDPMGDPYRGGGGMGGYDMGRRPYVWDGTWGGACVGWCMGRRDAGMCGCDVVRGWQGADSSAPRFTPLHRPRRSGRDTVASRQEMESIKRESAKLKDDLDVLTEENEFLVDKLRMAEEDLKEKQARVQELEKQVAKMGEGLSLEARLLNKKEAVLKQREASLKEMKDKSKDVKEVEITTLRMELESQREEAAAALEEARQASEEVRALRSLTARILLTPEEKEEVVLKRCWLARYWALASRHGVHAEIASSRSEHWQKYSPLPFEVVIDAGRKAREEPDGGEKEDKPAAVGTESNIESMFQVEKALRDLAALKVEEGVLLAMAQHRRPALLKVHSAPSAAEEGPRMVESMDLSDEEVEDVRFKQNWLVYWWRRARDHKVEPDIAAERLAYWISRSTVKPTAHDAVDAERGLMEVRKLNLEQQMWDASRKDLVAEAAAAAAVAAVAAGPPPSSK